MLSKQKIKKVLGTLEELYPNAESELVYNNPFELLISTILAAQCTDKRVNQVTKGLYEKYKTPEDFLVLPQEELERLVMSCGFYKNKSKNILETCKILVHKYNGTVPKKLEELVELPGVGRKTANVVISNVFNQPAIPVDTHVFRVSNRLGLAKSDNVLETEKQLMANIPKKLWSDAHHWLIYHGRRICKSRVPQCERCPLSEICQYYREKQK
ncbi:endonuclease III [Serpentinicella sp. ANB-PHB4]|uniref:endonuclease III n=1 Tax=Serpentinicella sp. ANB-PHB4 TaxID=3074076 RepID=UPI0028557F82|nr:endonuclease III [Serpentinicella sp. ANB-PHB4]MDR5658995.1 endonuclease III [Serpentinicella sp. ANB-PHB4]